MMNNGRMPFAYRAAMAVLAKNADAANATIAEALTEAGNKVADISLQYDESDWPFVITAMRTVANVLESSIDESGKLWTKQLSEHTSGIMIDATELKKQMEEEKDAGI